MLITIKSSASPSFVLQTKRKTMAKAVIEKSLQLPDCVYQNDPVLIKPSSETPKHFLPLSDLDDQLFLRFSIKFLFVFRRSIQSEWLKWGLSRVLVDYYPLAGRLRRRPDGGEKLEVDCNGEGALFAEAFLDVDSHDFLSFSWKPNRSWRTLLYKVQALNFTHVPPLVLQVALFSLSLSSIYLENYIRTVYFIFIFLNCKTMVFILEIIFKF